MPVAIVVLPAEGGSTAKFAMDCRGHKWINRVMNVVMQGMYRKGMRDHLAAFKTYCEGLNRASGGP